MSNFDLTAHLNNENQNVLYDCISSRYDTNCSGTGCLQRDVLQSQADRFQTERPNTPCRSAV